MTKFVFYIFGICLLAVVLIKVGVLGFGVSDAKERGIGVSPSRIEIRGVTEWPYTVPITVTNFSSSTENFEVTFEKDVNIVVSATPGRFSLESASSGRVLLSFEKPQRPADGLVKILSVRTSPEGFTTGTGMKIPFSLAPQADNTKFLAGIGEVFGRFGFHGLFGAGMVLATLMLLWQVAGIVQPWIFNSSKH